MAGLMADRPDFHPAQDALRDLSGRVPGESRYGGPGQPPLSLTTPPNSDRTDFRDSPLLHSGSGSQLGAMPSFKGAANPSAPPSIRETLSSAGDRLHGTLAALERIWGQLDEWEGVQITTAPGQAFPYPQAAMPDVRPPGVQEVAAGLLGLSDTLVERVMGLEERLGRLMERVGGL